MKRRLTLAVLLLLALAIGGFAVGTIVHVLRLYDTQRTLAQASQENVVWNVFQAEKEALRFHNALSRVMLEQSAGERPGALSVEQLAFRLDIFWSRLRLLREGEVGRILEEDPGQMARLTEFELDLPYFARQVEAGTWGKADLERMQERLSRGTAQLRQLSLKIFRTLSTREEQLRADADRAYRELAIFASLSAAGFLCMTGVLAVTLRRADRTAAEAAEARQQLRHALDHIGHGFALWDSDDRLVTCNERYRLLYHGGRARLDRGTSYEESLRLSLQQGLFPEAEGREEAWLRDQIERHRVCRGPFEQRLSDGRWVLADDKCLEDGSRVGLRIDITDLKRAREAAEAAARTKSRFLSVMSDEIKLPLAALSGALGQIVEQDLGIASRRRLEEAVQASNDLTTVIDQILELSDLESGRLRLEEVEFETEALIRAPAALLRSKVEAKGLRLELSVDPLLPRRLRSDPARIKQIIFNLLDNAIKFTDRGPVSLSLVHGSLSAPELTALRCEVRDSGAGVPAHLRSTLFSELMEGRFGEGRRAGGTGLGLIICARLVEALGGDIWFETEEGEGSCFSFEIPVVGTSTDSAVEGGSWRDAQEEPAALAVGDETASVLAVEDNRMNQRLLRAYLARLGVKAEVVADGATALERAGKRGYDLILMDVSLPGMDGTATAEALRNSQGPCRDVPILALTANAMPRDVQRCLDAGMNGHLAKPIDPVRLAQSLRRWLPSKIKGDAAEREKQPLPAAPLDPPALTSLVQASGEAVAVELLGDFLTEVGHRLELLRAAARRLDRVALAASGKAIAEQATVFGARPIFELARSIEVEAPHLSRGEAYRLSSELEHAYRLAIKAYEIWRGDLGVILDRLDDDDRNSA